VSACVPIAVAQQFITPVPRWFCLKHSCHGPFWTLPDAMERLGSQIGPCLRKRGRYRTLLDGLDGLLFTTDQKVGGSSPSERAQVRSLLPVR
jgi:hypothetical protein